MVYAKTSEIQPVLSRVAGRQPGDFSAARNRAESPEFELMSERSAV